MNILTLTRREPSSRLTPLMNLLEWTLLVLLAYLDWAGDGAPDRVVTLATAAWIVIALLCATLWVISLLTEEGTAP